MEKKTKHTPGEWYVGQVELFKGGDSMVVCPKNPYITDEGYRSICQVSPMEDADDEDFANALLIAAAPEMLAMLEELMAHKTFASHLPTTALKVQALIKKSTGDE